MIGLLSKFLTLRLHYSNVFPSTVLSFPPHSASRFHSGVQVSICFLSRSPFLSHFPSLCVFYPRSNLPLSHTHSLSLLPSHLLSLETPKTFLPNAGGWNIRLPNYWKQQRGTIPLSFTPSCSFSSSNSALSGSKPIVSLLYLPFSLLMETVGPLRPNLRYVSSRSPSVTRHQTVPIIVSPSLFSKNVRLLANDIRSRVTSV